MTGTNPAPSAVVDDGRTLGVNSPQTFTSKKAGVGSMVETSRDLMPEPCALGRPSWCYQTLDPCPDNSRRGSAVVVAGPDTNAWHTPCSAAWPLPYQQPARSA